jgi:adenosine deaminase
MMPPVAELHVHLEGTLEAELIMTLSARNGVRLPYADVDGLRAAYRFTDLQSFLDLYFANMAVLRTEADFEAMTMAYLRRAAQAGVRHAEVFFDPQAHVARGVPLDVAMAGVTGALEASEREFGLSSALIVCFLRDLGGHEAMATLDDVLRLDVPILGVGLDSAEVGHPPAAFAAVFARARAAGLVTVAHAGEEGPASYVWEAIDVLQVDRIDHGIRSLDDPNLVARLVADRMPLTVCPLSNVRLGAVATVAGHPIAEMLRRGLMVTVNSDDPAYFGGYIDDNFAAIAAGSALGRPELAQLARNSFEASFVAPGRRQALLDEVNAWEDGLALGDHPDERPVTDGADDRDAAD